MRMFMKARHILVLAILFAIPAISFAQVRLSITVAPPMIPVYTQPPCPEDGFLWTPGYWAYGPAGYYWVPGVWVAPPQPGLLWTSGYWGFVGGFYGWHGGYWGPHVGFYGGVNYGFGYGGVGFYGGRWEGGHFAYNTAVMNVNRTVVRNVYEDRTVIRNSNNRVSFNGPGGVNARPTAEERTAMQEQHVQRTSEQMSHQQMASRDPSQRASANHGNPGTPAMGRVNARSNNQPGRTGNAVRSGATTPHGNANAGRNGMNTNRGSAATPHGRPQGNQQQSRPSHQANQGGHNDKPEHH